MHVCCSRVQQAGKSGLLLGPELGEMGEDRSKDVGDNQMVTLGTGSFGFVSSILTRPRLIDVWAKQPVLGIKEKRRWFVLPRNLPPALSVSRTERK